MKLSLRGRRGVASVIGTMLFVIVLMAGLGAVAYVYSLQAQSSQAAQQAQQLVNQHGKESLTYQTLSGGSLAVTNTGSSASTIKYVILKFANGTVYQLAPSQGISSGGQLSVPSLIPSQNCGLSTCLAKYKLILSSTTPGNNVGLVTALGNTFWVNPTTLQAGSSGTTTYQVTFAATGDGSFGSNPVVTVDGTNYVASQLPITLTWTAGTLHSYSYQTYTPSSGTLIGPTSVSGLSTCSTSCLISAASAGTVTAAYTTQYSLTVSGGGGVTESPTPNSDGYYNAGTSVQVATNYVWSQVAGQSRQNLVSYSLNGGSAVSVTRADTGTYAVSVTMSSPQTLAFNANTQYYVTTQFPVPSAGLVSPTIGYSYSNTITVANALANPSFGLGSTSGWSAPTCSSCYSNTIGSVSGSYPVYTGDTASGYGFESGSTGGYYYANGFSQSVTTPAAATSVTFSAEIYAADEQWLNGASVAVWGASGGGSCGGTVTATDAAWVLYTCTYTPSAGTTSFTAYMYQLGYCGSGQSFTGYSYFDSADFSYSYVGSTSGTLADAPTDTVSGNTVTYYYPVSYAFPPNLITGQLQISGIPSTETVSSVLVGAGPSALPSSAYTVSGTTVTIPVSTIQSYGDSYIVLATLTQGLPAVTTNSATGDCWFDSGSVAQVQVPYVWNQVNGQSRQNLVSYSVDGGTSAQVPRADTGIYTISIAMGTYHTVAIGSVTQYYLTLGTPTVTSQLPPPAISYSVNNALTNPSFGTGTTTGWSAFYECLYCNGGVGIGSVVTSPVYTGDSYSGLSSYSYWTTGTIKYGLHYYDGGYGFEQSVTIPSTATSVTASVEVYPAAIASGGSAYMTVVGLSSCSTSVTASGTSWVLLSCTSTPTSTTLTMELYTYGGSGEPADSVSFDNAVMSYSGPGTDTPTSSASGGIVTYSYPLSFAFPSGTTGQLQLTIPSTETLSEVLIGSGPSVLSSSSYTVSSGTVTIPAATISADGGSYTVVATYSGAYSVSQSGSQTGDGWYDSGTGAAITASASGPYVFASWTQTDTLVIGSAIAASTMVSMNSYDTVTANFNMGE